MMFKNNKTIQQLQYDICKIISNIGGKIKWAKEYGLPARINYFLSRKEPVINIEVLFLGERFGIVINNGKEMQHKIASSKHRIMYVTSLQDFKDQFENFKKEKLGAT